MMTHDIPHKLDMETAKLAARKAVEAYGARFEKYDFSANWVSDTRVELGFSVKGKRLNGAMTVRPNDLHLELDVPFVFKVFSGKAIDIIDREAKEWIRKAEAGELQA